jgi:hypothetical protein
VFADFNLELGYDSLWVYSGYYPGGDLLGAYTGSTLPPVLNASEVMSIRFKSDNLTTEAGWTAYIGNFNVSVNELFPQINTLSVYPNPASDFINVELPSSAPQGVISIYDVKGQRIHSQAIEESAASQRINVSSFPAGIYLIVASDQNTVIGQQKILVMD